MRSLDEKDRKRAFYLCINVPRLTDEEIKNYTSQQRNVTFQRKSYSNQLPSETTAFHYNLRKSAIRSNAFPTQNEFCETKQFSKELDRSKNPDQHIMVENDSVFEDSATNRKSNFNLFSPVTSVTTLRGKYHTSKDESSESDDIFVLDKKSKKLKNNKHVCDYKKLMLSTTAHTLRKNVLNCNAKKCKSDKRVPYASKRACNEFKTVSEPDKIFISMYSSGNSEVNSKFEKYDNPVKVSSPIIQCKRKESKTRSEDSNPTASTVSDKCNISVEFESVKSTSGDTKSVSSSSSNDNEMTKIVPLSIQSNESTVNISSTYPSRDDNNFDKISFTIKFTKNVVQREISNEHDDKFVLSSKRLKTDRTSPSCVSTYKKKEEGQELHPTVKIVSDSDIKGLNVLKTASQPMKKQILEKEKSDECNSLSTSEPKKFKTDNVKSNNTAAKLIKTNNIIEESTLFYKLDLSSVCSIKRKFGEEDNSEKKMSSFDIKEENACKRGKLNIDTIASSKQDLTEIPIQSHKSGESNLQSDLKFRICRKNGNNFVYKATEQTSLQPVNVICNRVCTTSEKINEPSVNTESEKIKPVDSDEAIEVNPHKIVPNIELHSSNKPLLNEVENKNKNFNLNATAEKNLKETVNTREGPNVEQNSNVIPSVPPDRSKLLIGKIRVKTSTELGCNVSFADDVIKYSSTHLPNLSFQEKMIIIKKKDLNFFKYLSKKMNQPSETDITIDMIINDICVNELLPCGSNLRRFAGISSLSYIRPQNSLSIINRPVIIQFKKNSLLLTRGNP